MSLSPESKRKKEISPWQIFAKLTGAGVDLSVDYYSYGRIKIPTLRLDYEPDSEQEEAVKAFQEPLKARHCQDALVAITREHLCDPHNPDVPGAPFVPNGLTIAEKNKRGDPVKMEFATRRGKRATWTWRKLGTAWRWAKTK